MVTRWLPGSALDPQATGALTVRNRGSSSWRCCVFHYFPIGQIQKIEKMFCTVVAAALWLSLGLASTHRFDGGGHNELPIVDLGYERQKATLYNQTGGFYNFSNIRYAAPPTGNNRFRAPLSPAVNRGSIQTGLPDRICPQADPAWLLIAEEYIPLYLKGQTVFNQSEFNISSATSGGIPPQDPRTTEDCLFLDVVVPVCISLVTVPCLRHLLTVMPTRVGRYFQKCREWIRRASSRLDVSNVDVIHMAVVADRTSSVVQLRWRIRSRFQE